MLSPWEIERHKRHILLKDIGGPGVERLRDAKVSLIGAGALGGPCALYLAGAGIGEIELWDDDVVQRSNLQRQVHFEDSQINQRKAELLGNRIKALNPGTRVDRHPVRFEEGAVPRGSVLIDASDNFSTRFLLNAVAHKTRRYLVSGAASQWNGQVSVFASGVQPGAPCYRCFVPEMPPEGDTCETNGVIGAMTGHIGALMAMEVVKLITGAGEPLIGRVYIMDGLASRAHIVKLRSNRGCGLCSARGFDKKGGDVL